MKQMAFLAAVFLYFPVFAQFYNYGNLVINSSTDLYVVQNFSNQPNGSVDNAGTILVEGDWENNNSSNQVFVNSSPGMVRLIGSNQVIKGNNSTKFFNLSLEGTGIKSMDVDAEVEGNLFLNDRELATNQHIMYVSNPSINAITLTTGFVSSIGDGYLTRKMNTTQPYLFPTGSSSGTPRYRPVELTPVDNNVQVMGVRLANTNPDNEGYFRNITNGSVSNINSEFFHKITQISGLTANSITIYYDETADGSFNGIAHWDDFPYTQWKNTTSATIVQGTPLSSISIPYWADYLEPPFALFGCTPPQDPTSITASATNICGNETVLLTVQGGNLGTGGNWTWYEGSCNGTQIGIGATISVNPTQTTTYFVNGVGTCGTTSCVSITITVGNVPVVNATSNSPVCEGQQIQLSASGGEQYQWFGPAGFNSSLSNPVINQASAQHSGTYTVIVTSADGCSNTGQVNVVVNPLPQGTIISSQTVCEGQDITLTATGGTTYQWSGPNNFSATNASVTITNVSITNAGVYYVTISDANGCSVELTTTISIQQAPQVTASYTGAACEGSTITLQSSPSGMQSYQWSGPNNFNSNAQNPVLSNVTDNMSGLYTVSVTHACGTATASVQVMVYSNPEINFSVQHESCKDMNDGQILTTVQGTEPIQYNWSNSATTAELISLSSGMYSLTVTDANGCSASQTTTINKGEHDCFFIPTVFSPNGDGNNDVLYVRAHGVKEMIFRIFDRWGNMIFESTTPAVGWDGTYKGKPMNAGAYAYYVKISFVNSTEKEIRDNVTLIR